MNFRFFFFSILGILAILFATPTSSGYAKPMQAEPRQDMQGSLLCATSVPNFASFPSVTVNFRMLDTNLLPIIPSDAELRFAENGNTPVPLVGSVQPNQDGVGINYYVVVDKGNRSPQVDVRRVLEDLTQYYSEQRDTISIYTNEKNITNLYYPGTVANSLAEAVSKYPIDGDSQPRQVMGSLEQVITAVEQNPDPCQNPKVILMIVGDDTLDKKKILEYGKRIKDSMSKLVIFHLNSEYGSFVSRDIYSDLANQTGGIYKQVLSIDNDIRPVLDQISLYSRAFSASYRSNYGKTGTHTISAIYQGVNIPIRGTQSYQIDIQPPSVSLTGTTIIDRIKNEDPETQKDTYSHDSEPYTVGVIWQDSYPRDILENAKLVVYEDGKSEQIIDVALREKGDGTYEINWNFSDREEVQEYKFNLSLIVTDEFGNAGKSEPLAITLNVKTGKTPVSDAFKYTLYGLVGLVIILILLMIFGWIFFRSQMSSVAARGGAMVGKIAGEIRKTIVGGGKRGKPLASIKVLDGPPTMIGQELKIYTESVKLGRNPQVADMTFYGPDVNTSISGLHARLEKISSAWRIVALSQSGSETFVDDQPIPFNEPVRLNSGQKIRMGYFAQQPVVLEFSAEPDSRKTQIDQDNNNPKKTDVSSTEMDDKAEAANLFGRRAAPVVTKQAPEDSDSVFDEFR